MQTPVLPKSQYADQFVLGITAASARAGSAIHTAYQEAEMPDLERRSIPFSLSSSTCSPKTRFISKLLCFFNIN
jgi:hypothetical protein